MTTPLLSINAARKTFGGIVAVDEVSFDVEEGELLALIGPNGSGKTTMINLISGLFAPTSGSIELAGQRISGQPVHAIARQSVARTFQLVRVLPSLTAVENVMAGAMFGSKAISRDDALELANRLLAKVGFQDRDGMSVSALTYIDMKRIELARALAANPRVLLLDEWLAGLNPTELVTGIDLIGKINSEGRTIIMVEHVMDAIRALCRRSVVMSSGLKLADGPTAAVLSQSDVVRAYLGDDGA